MNPPNFPPIHYKSSNQFGVPEHQANLQFPTTSSSPYYLAWLKQSSQSSLPRSDTLRSRMTTDSLETQTTLNWETVGNPLNYRNQQLFSTDASLDAAADAFTATDTFTESNLLTDFGLNGLNLESIGKVSPIPTPLTITSETLKRDAFLGTERFGPNSATVDLTTPKEVPITPLAYFKNVKLNVMTCETPMEPSPARETFVKMSETLQQLQPNTSVETLTGLPQPEVVTDQQIWQMAQQAGISQSQLEQWAQQLGIALATQNLVTQNLEAQFENQLLEAQLLEAGQLLEVSSHGSRSPSLSPQLSPNDGRNRSISDLSIASWQSGETQTLGRGKKHQCPTCQKTFTRKYNLEGHMRAHRGEKPFDCSVCKTAFTRKADLERHKKIHVKAGLLEEEPVAHRRQRSRTVSHERRSTLDTLTSLEPSESFDHSRFNSTDIDLGSLTLGQVQALTQFAPQYYPQQFSTAQYQYGGQFIIDGQFTTEELGEPKPKWSTL